jgi:hypothetical protein
MNQTDNIFDYFSIIYISLDYESQSLQIMASHLKCIMFVYNILLSHEVDRIF